MARLEYSLDGQIYTLEVPRTGLTIGREAADGVVALDNHLFSRRHFTIQMRGSVFMVSDLGSSNGTMLDGVRLAQMPVPLRHGSKIQVGDTTFIFDLEAAQSSSPTQQAPKTARNASAANATTAATNATTTMPTVTLYLLDDQGATVAEYRLGAQTSIGRDPSNTIPLSHDLVSGHHCSIEFRNSQFVISDLGSSNGTWVGARKIQQKPLRRGDVITLSQVVRLAFDDPEAFQKAGGAEGLVSMREAVAAAVPSTSSVWKKAFVIGGTIAVVLALAGFLLPTLLSQDATPVATKLKTSGLSAEGRYSFEDNAQELRSFVNSSGNIARMGIDRGFADTGSQCLLIEAASTPNSFELRLDPLISGDSPDVKVSLATLSGGGVIGVAILELEEPATRRRIQFAERVVSHRPKEDAWSSFTVGGRFSGSYAGWTPVLRLVNLTGVVRLDSVVVTATPSDTPPHSVKTSRGLSITRVGEQVLEVGQEASPGLRAEILSLAPDVSLDQTTVVTSLEVRGGESEFRWEQRYRESPSDAFRSLDIHVGASQSGRNEGRATLTIKRPAPDPKARVPVALRISSSGTDAAVFDHYLNQTNLRQPTVTAVGAVRYLVIGGLSLHFEPMVGVIVGSSQGGEQVITVAPVGVTPSTTQEALTIQIDDADEPKRALARLVSREAGELMNPSARGRLPNYSAALERAKWLLERQGSGMEEIRTSGKRLTEAIDERRSADLAQLNKAFESAQRRDAPIRDIEVAQKAVLDYLESWPGEPNVAEMRDWHERLVNLMDNARATIGLAGSALREKKPTAPALEEERKQDEARAAALLDFARQMHTEGNWLVAFAMVDNIEWNLHYTASAEAATALANQIKEAWANTAERTAYIEPLMEYARSLEYLDGDLAELKDVLRRIVQRYPRSTEAASAKQKLIALGG